MTTWKLTEDGDLDTEGGLTLLDDVLTETKQRLTIKFRFFLGEWFQDPRIGVPYYEKIFVKSPRLEEVRAIFREIITTDPAVSSLKKLSLDFDTPSRSMSLSFEALLNDGSSLTFEDFILSENRE
jgi:hypothetical protein